MQVARNVVNYLEKVSRELTLAIAQLRGRALAIQLSIAELERVRSSIRGLGDGRAKPKTEQRSAGESAGQRQAKAWPKGARKAASRRGRAVRAKGERARKASPRRTKEAPQAGSPLVKPERAREAAPRRRAANENKVEQATPSTERTDTSRTVIVASMEQVTHRAEADVFPAVQADATEKAAAQVTGSDGPKAKKRKPWSAQARARMSQSQKARWAKKRGREAEEQAASAKKPPARKTILRRRSADRPGTEPAARLSFEDELREFIARRRAPANAGVAEAMTRGDQPAAGPVAMAAAVAGHANREQPPAKLHSSSAEPGTERPACEETGS